MKKFSLKILYLIPLFLFLFYLEYNLGKIENSYTFKKKHLENQLDSIQVLVLGSSQAARGINPIYFSKKGYNLANLSQTLYYDIRLTSKYIDKMPNLKYVIINVSYFSLGYQLIDGVENWRDYYYSQFWDINYYELEKFDIKRYSKTFLYTPQISLTYLKKRFDINLVGGYSNSGYLNENNTKNVTSISDSLGYARVKLHDNCYKEKRVQENKKDLDSFLQALKEKNITAILITPPVFSTYYKFVNPERLIQNHKIINMLCDKYKCKYYDYFKDTSFEKKDFMDNDHLNLVGSEKFSKLINNDILEKNQIHNN